MGCCESESGVEGDEIDVFWRNRTRIWGRGDGANGFVVLSPCNVLSVIFNGTRLSPVPCKETDPSSTCCVKMMGLVASDQSAWSSELSSEVSNRALLSRPGGRLVQLYRDENARVQTLMMMVCQGLAPMVLC